MAQVSLTRASITHAFVSNKVSSSIGDGAFRWQNLNLTFAPIKARRVQVAGHSTDIAPDAVEQLSIDVRQAATALRAYLPAA